MNRKSKTNSGNTHPSLRFLLYLRLALYSVLEAMSRGTALGYRGWEDDPLDYPDRHNADEAE